MAHVTMKSAHTDGRGSLVYTPDGRQVITAGADTFVKIFEASNVAAEPHTIEHHDAAITSIAVDPKGKHIATGTESHLASYFGFPDVKFLKHLTRAQSAVQCVAFDHKGRFLAAGAEDGVIRVCATNTPQPVAVLLKGHSDSVLCVAYDPKGEYLASSSADGTVRIWDMNDEATTIKSIRITSKIAPDSSQRFRIAWDPSGAFLAVPYSNGVQLIERGSWTTETKCLGGHTKEVSLVAWSRNGQYLATSGLDRQTFVWQLSSNESLDRYKNDAVPTDIAWSPCDNALSFIDEAGRLGSWRSVIPSHLPSPFGEDVASAAAASAALESIPAAAAVPGPARAQPGAQGAVPREPESEQAREGGAEPTTMPSLDDVDVADTIVDAAADAVEAAMGSGRRRLRKVAHDSDDGGFSDHDDDEAAEAALLAREIAKRAGGSAGAHGLPKAEGLVADVKGMLSATGAMSAAQPVLHSSATPLKHGRRFLLWNMTGMVISRDETVFSAIEVDFNSTDKHRTIRLTDHYGFSMAALDDAAVMFASRSNHGNPSTVVYRPLISWAPNSEWQVQLDKGEETLAIALGHKFAAIATSRRYLRILSHTGAQRALICVGGPLVALAAWGGLCALVTHAGRAAVANDQAMVLNLYDLRETSRPVRIASAPLPLSEGASLAWVGFSESGVLSTVDTAGIVRGCLRSYGFEWVPLLDCNAIKKAKNEHHWVVGLTDKELLAVLCKADTDEEAFPATLPRPVVTPLSLAMPLACAEPSEPAQEKERLLQALALNEYRAVAVDDGHEDNAVVRDKLLRGDTKLDSSTLKLLASACKHERNARALDLAFQLKLPKSLVGALKLANHYKLGPLAERISRLMESRFKDGDGEEDMDLDDAPAAAPLPARPIASAPVAPATKTEADDEPEAGAEPPQAPSAGEARAPLNPFAKTNAAKDTATMPKRSLPLTAAAGGKKAMRK